MTSETMTSEPKSRTSGSKPAQSRAWLVSSVNVWGNKKADINPDEYCVNCEQDTRRGHYSFCPALAVMDQS
jgi:hypothetical protein